MTTKPIPIDEVANCSCLRIRKATRRITQIYDQLLEPSGITTTQFSLLAHLMPLKRISIGTARRQELSQGRARQRRSPAARDLPDRPRASGTADGVSVVA
jgi:hypothetical protein